MTIVIEELLEAGIDLPPIDVRTVDLTKCEQFMEAFTAVNPNQIIPGLRDGERTVMESCAILLYLAEKFPSPLLPPGEARWDASDRLAVSVSPRYRRCACGRRTSQQG